MGIEITSGGVSKTFRYYPIDALYVDECGNVNTEGNGVQVREVYFNKVKYYPEPRPMAIHVTRMPDKTTYEDGETIDYTGIEVSLYVKYEETVGPDGSIHVDAEPFRDARYPDGKIPFNELTFPASTTDDGTPVSPDSVYVGGLDVGGPIEYAEGVVSKNIELSMGEAYIDRSAPYMTRLTGYGEFCMSAGGRDEPTTVRYTGIDHGDGSYDLIYAWLPPRGRGGVNYYGRIGDKTCYGIATAAEYAVTFDGKTVLYGGSGGLRGGSEVFYCTKPNAVSKINKGYGDSIATRAVWYMWYGDFVRDRLPVTWDSPYDGVNLKTSFLVEFARENEES